MGVSILALFQKKVRQVALSYRSFVDGSTLLAQFRSGRRVELVFFGCSVPSTRVINVVHVKGTSLLLQLCERFQTLDRGLFKVGALGADPGSGGFGGQIVVRVNVEVELHLCGVEKNNGLGLVIGV